MSSKTTEIQRVEPASETRRFGDFDVSNALRSILESDNPTEKVEVLKELIAMKREQDALNAKRECNRAFAALQRDCEKIQAKTAIPLRDGSIKSRYAKFEQIFDELKEKFPAHGFGYPSFNQELDDKGRTKVTCILMHESGDQIERTFMVRTQKSPNNTEAQDDGGSFTFAKRYALCAMLNIVISTDQDARPEGQQINPEAAADLERRVRAVAANDDDARRLLAITGAATFAEITSDRVGGLVRELEKREQAKAPKTKSVKDMLKARILEWSGCTPDELGATSRRIFAACNLPTDRILNESEARAALDWIEKCMKSNSPFDGAC